MLNENKPKTAEEWDKAIGELEIKHKKDVEIRLGKIKNKYKVLEEMRSKVKDLKPSQTTYVYNVPIIENSDKFKKLNTEEVITLLNQSIIYDIKDIASRKKQLVGIFKNARYNEGDDIYYGDIHLYNKEYERFKKVNNEIIRNNNGKLEFITFYVKKINK